MGIGERLREYGHTKPFTTSSHENREDTTWKVRIVADSFTKIKVLLNKMDLKKQQHMLVI